MLYQRKINLNEIQIILWCSKPLKRNQLDNSLRSKRQRIKWKILKFFCLDLSWAVWRRIRFEENFMKTLTGVDDTVVTDLFRIVSKLRSSCLGRTWIYEIWRNAIVGNLTKFWKIWSFSRKLSSTSTLMSIMEFLSAWNQGFIPSVLVLVQQKTLTEWVLIWCWTHKVFHTLNRKIIFWLL